MSKLRGKYTLLTCIVENIKISFLLTLPASEIRKFALSRKLLAEVALKIPGNSSKSSKLRIPRATVWDRSDFLGTPWVKRGKVSEVARSAN